MNNEKMGQFIAELRKSKQMTQKELAEKLNVTDKAVSKWERGLSCPDISLLSPLSAIFEITTNELLNGERSHKDQVTIEETIDHVLDYANEAVESKTSSFSKISAAVFSLLLFLALFVCAVCDFALSGKFTWSLIANSAILFTWLLFFPSLRYGKRGIVGSLISLSLFIVPFLAILNNLIKTNGLILAIGFRVSVIALAYFWIIYALFHLFKTKKLFAMAVALFCSIPAHLLINRVLSKMISEPFIDRWDLMVFVVIIGLGLMLLVVDFANRRHRNLQTERG